ncbi:hypothetical protein [Legionella oakridgensis]|uniref:Uncharacterized protein n=2 Tax=Legionella oakridgensis TaxID=29423 RepID=W0BC13_9GAMM|nr:hypothetical protein [Legionella oakridgensis]AHE66226.1 hypothetical protein Loa_00657 [Legionella oakridgensis ATCC 33761 = DSM 21215]ETO93975.1 hypothetical protein LOR_93c25200 [Legionella oakridgensis RV-2-2007]KTD44776.1 hypothetical protein Loak_0026 [Legionella oakridgensis]STY16129.1 Uncharacterised protein [Legionella longbeachae]
MKKAIAISAVLFSYSAFAETLTSLSKEEVLSTFQGKTIKSIPLANLDNRLIADSFMGYFDKNGQITGKFTKKPQGNDPQTDDGTWRVKDDGTLCVTWKHWFNSKEVCALTYPLGNGYLFVNPDNNNFESLIHKDIKSGNQITG